MIKATAAIIATASKASEVTICDIDRAVYGYPAWLGLRGRRLRRERNYARAFDATNFAQRLELRLAAFPRSTTAWVLAMCGQARPTGSSLQCRSRARERREPCSGGHGHRPHGKARPSLQRLIIVFSTQTMTHSPMWYTLYAGNRTTKTFTPVNFR